MKDISRMGGSTRNLSDRTRKEEQGGEGSNGWIEEENPTEIPDDKITRKQNKEKI